MIEYKVTIDRQRECFIIEGGFSQDAFPINIPEDDPDKKDFINYFLHKADLDRAIDFLRCISIDKNTTVNEGLFLAGLNNFIKCFKFSASRDRLNKDIVFIEDEQMKQLFYEFEAMRDKHFDHDENGMLQAIAFLFVNQDEQNPQIFGGPPSVVWNRVMFDYYMVGQRLHELIIFTRKFIVAQIDLIGVQITKRYEYYPRIELIKFESVNICLASADNIGNTRTTKK